MLTTKNPDGTWSCRDVDLKKWRQQRRIRRTLQAS